MRTIYNILNAFLTSATPNILLTKSKGVRDYLTAGPRKLGIKMPESAAKKRQKGKDAIASGLREDATATQGEIDTLKTQNPFESAAAKSAMAQSSRKARQTQQRFANMMGGNANPESMIAAQQATQEAVAGTAGDIATGAEANKAQQIAGLRNLKASQTAQANAAKMGALGEYGQGWKDFLGNLSTATESVGNITEGVGNVMDVFS